MDFLEGILYMLWRGIAIGVIISAPMGPVGILCVQRTLEKGRTTGFFTGIGAALSDLFYCLLTGFGLSFIEDFLKANQNAIQIIGSVVLILFGVYLFKSNPARSLKKPDSRPPSKGKNVLSGFLFTFSNPLIIFLIIGLFARFNFSLPEISLGHYIVGYIFIFIGALIWWWIVSWFVDKVRNHFNLRSMWLINKITGGIIMIFALVGIITAISNIASAAEYKPVILANETADIAIKNINLGKEMELPLSFRVSNLKYKGKNESRWGLILTDNRGDGREIKINFSLEGNPGDELVAPTLSIVAVTPYNSESTAITSGLDLYDGANSFRFQRVGDYIILYGGDREYKPLLEMWVPHFKPDAISFELSPGGKIEVGAMQVGDALSRKRAMDLDDWENPYIDSIRYADKSWRDSIISRSSDPIVGEWVMYDRMLEDEWLNCGGEYRLMALKTPSGYDLIYLSGADKLKDGWDEGMIKCKLEETPFKGVFDAEWYDPLHAALPGVVKAQLQGDNMLEFSFPALGNSTLRLRKSQ